MSVKSNNLPGLRSRSERNHRLNLIILSNNKNWDAPELVIFSKQY